MKTGPTIPAKMATPIVMPAADVIAAINGGAYTTDELRAMRRASQQYENQRYNYGAALASTLSPGTAVRLNDNYYYKTLRGMTGTVVEVKTHASRRNIYSYVKVKLDCIPTGRRPIYQPDKDNNVLAHGAALDVI